MEQEKREDRSAPRSGGSGKSDEGSSLRELVEGTARIGKSVGETFKGVAEVFTGREFVVMVRVNRDSLERIDQLVESGLFRSRSESAAFLIARGIEANQDLYEKIENKVTEINRLRDDLRKLVNFSSDKLY